MMELEKKLAAASGKPGESAAVTYLGTEWWGTELPSNNVFSGCYSGCGDKLDEL